MDEPQETSAQEPGSNPPAVPAKYAVPEAARRTLLRRLMTLLAVGTAAFALTTWTLVRLPDPFVPLEPGTGAAGVVRAHLEALGRGELRTAYDMFSLRYREKVSFEAYHDLVSSHRGLFRFRDFRLSRDDEIGGRAVLETRIVTANGEHYLARFTLVRLSGRWWIDDLRWAGAAPPRGRMTI